MSISTLILKLEKIIEDIAIINSNFYCFACKLKNAQLFAISIKDEKFSFEKATKLEKKQKNIIQEDFQDFSYIFSKKNLDRFFSH